VGFAERLSGRRDDGPTLYFAHSRFRRRSDKESKKVGNADARRWLARRCHVLCLTSRQHLPAQGLDLARSIWQDVRERSKSNRADDLPTTTRGVHMSDGGSISRWLEGLKAGDADDIGQLWDRYFERLVALAATRLPRHARRDVDAEDVALSAFQSFCDRAGQGKFAQLDSRDDLWRLLATITCRKAVRTLRDRGRQKRGGGNVLGESAVGNVAIGDDTAYEGLAGFLGREPGPDAAVEFADDFDRLMEDLDNPTLRMIALRRLEGHSSEEIAAERGVSARTVDRKLELIRARWEGKVK
jgi:DNA-directed RNA polymerase specialized sigma24 family protein